MLFYGSGSRCERATFAQATAQTVTVRPFGIRGHTSTVSPCGHDQAVLPFLIGRLEAPFPIYRGPQNTSVRTQCQGLIQHKMNKSYDANILRWEILIGACGRLHKSAF